MGRVEYGTSLENGRVLHWSATALTSGDPDSEDGCPRRFFYERVLKKRPPQTKAQGAGVELHDQIEKYLITGVNSLGSLALRGKHMIPDPGPDLMVEHNIVVPPEVEIAARQAEIEGRHAFAADIRAAATLDKAPLQLRGIPVIGYIDLVHGRETNKGVSDIEETQDPEGTVEVLDWKTTSSTDYIKTPMAMASTTQMTIYGKWVLKTLDGAEHVRLSHAYFVTRGPGQPRKVTMRVRPEQIERQWERVDRVAGLLVDVAREKDVDKVPANTRACGAFGGCPHRSYCRAGAQNALTNLFGKAGADTVLRRLNKMSDASSAETARTPGKSLLGLGKKSSVTPEQQAAMTLKLDREEIEAKYPGVPAAFDELNSFFWGHPQFSGELAKIVGRLRGVEVDASGGLAGFGKLANEGPFSDPLDILGLPGEVKQAQEAEAAQAQPILGGLLPPDSPPPDVLLALATEAPAVPEGTSAAPEAPAPDAPPAPEAGDPAPTKRRGRPPGSKNKPRDPAAAEALATVPATADPPAPPTDAATQAAPADLAETPAAPAAPSPLAATPLLLFLNCMPRSQVAESLWPLVSDITDELNKRAGVFRDFRLVDTKHDLGYSRWRGLAADMVRVLDIAPGMYVLDGIGGSEIAQIVAETMAAIVESRGGLVVQGAR